MNVGSENNYGVNVFGSVPIGKKLSLRSNISVFDRYITTGTLGGPAINSFNYRINLNAAYQFSSAFIFEFFGNFNSARNEIQGRYPSFTSYTRSKATNSGTRRPASPSPPPTRSAFMSTRRPRSPGPILR